MRSLALVFLLTTFVSSQAQSATERFLAADQQWTAHRPDGLTWDDGTPEAAQALDTMWSAIAHEANNFLLAHPDAQVGDLQAHLEQLKPREDQQFGNGLSAYVVKLGEQLFAVSFTDDVASTAIVLRPHTGSPIAWYINGATAQGRDTGGLLRAWQSSRAGDDCSKREPDSLYRTCGPLTSTVGQLPPSASGAPRFYVEATYSKDAGASFAEQLSIWEWEGSVPALLWIDRYIVHTEATRPLRVSGPSLTFGEQDDFETFFACMSCDGRQLLRGLQVTSSGVKDLGTKVLYPELDRVDDLFVALAKHSLTNDLASPEVASVLREPLRQAAKRSANVSSKSVFVGMLSDWSVTRGDHNEENVCVITEDLGRLDFAYVPAPSLKGFFKSVKRISGSSQCPRKNVIHQSYSASE